MIEDCYIITNAVFELAEPPLVESYEYKNLFNATVIRGEILAQYTPETTWRNKWRRLQRCPDHIVFLELGSPCRGEGKGKVRDGKRDEC